METWQLYSPNWDQLIAYAKLPWQHRMHIGTLNCHEYWATRIQTWWYICARSSWLHQTQLNNTYKPWWYDRNCHLYHIWFHGINGWYRRRHQHCWIAGSCISYTTKTNLCDRHTIPNSLFQVGLSFWHTKYRIGIWQGVEFWLICLYFNLYTTYVRSYPYNHQTLTQDIA